jgi:hypothetical protein
MTTSSGIDRRWEQSMKMVKRWGVMTLVALLVLGTMGAAVADDDVEAESAKTPLEQGEYEPDLAWSEDLEWVDDLVQFVFYWGYPENVEATCGDTQESASTTGAGLFGIHGGLTVTDEVPAVCVSLNVEKNGHYNHGSMVSSVVHWLKELKDGDLDELVEANPGLEDLLEMPKGQLVKMFAQNEFGKGNFVLPVDETLEAAGAEGEESDGHGPPAWANNKKDKKAKGKNK